MAGGLPLWFTENGEVNGTNAQVRYRVGGQLWWLWHFPVARGYSGCHSQEQERSGKAQQYLKNFVGVTESRNH